MVKLKLDFCRIQNTKSDISYLKKNLMHFDAFDLISVLHVGKLQMASC